LYIRDTCLYVGILRFHCVRACISLVLSVCNCLNNSHPVQQLIITKLLNGDTSLQAKTIDHFHATTHWHATYICYIPSH